MKWILLMTTCSLLMFGCQLKPDVWRTGSVCIPTPTITDNKTNDFVNAKPDLVALIASELSKNIKIKIASDSKLNIAECGTADYQLVTALNKVATENRQYVNSWTGWRSNLNHYDIGVIWALDGKGYLLTDDLTKSGTNLNEMVQSMSEEIVDHIKMIESK